jgi:hypothetical protein
VLRTAQAVRCGGDSFELRLFASGAAAQVGRGPWALADGAAELFDAAG